MLRIAVAAALLFAAGQAQAASRQFDLVCDMTAMSYVVDAAGAREPTGEPAGLSLQIHYAVDLAARKWCPVSKCAENGTRAIASVSDDAVVFDHTVREQMLGDVVLDRRALTLKVLTRPPAGRAGPSIEMTGQCREQPFTPFPPRAG